MKHLTNEELEVLLPLGTSLIADAIETFKVRLQNEGFFSGASIRCMTSELGPMLGYAVPARIRSGSPAMRGTEYAENYAWWNYIRKIPEPRIVVLEDFDDTPGVGAFIDETQAEIYKALGCVGVVTNGAVRNIEQINDAAFHCFASRYSVSQAYAHIANFGIEVGLNGLLIQPGNLLYGDGNGLLTIPIELATKIPDVAAEIAEKKRKTIALCNSADFSAEKLKALTESFGETVSETGLRLKKHGYKN
jgi:4-hydroxy-4-methyl-2-oxoglutarate aldolase